MKTVQLQTIFEANRDRNNASKQKAYLKNQFEFLGLAKPIRAKLELDFVKSTKLLVKDEIIDLCFELANLDYREYLYTSQMVLQANYKKFDYDDILNLVEITRHNQWWENTDGFQSFLKKWFKLNPQYIAPFVLGFYRDENLWVRRLAIIAQLGMKELTDFSVMQRAICYNFTDNQFFIQKAIGWALRDYSKTNSVDVQQFIENNNDKLSALAIREGSKYL